MFCRNCGKTAEENALFCTGCGARLFGPDTDTIAATVTEVIEKPVEASETQQAQPEEKALYEQQTQPTFTGAVPPPVMPEIRYTEPLPEKPKTFFGTGALVLCLAVIGLLSISTGVFAGLFFSLLK